MQFGTSAILILLTVVSQIFAQLVPKRNDSTCKAGMAHYCVTRRLPGRDGKEIVGVYSPLQQPTKNCHLVISNLKRSQNCCDPFKFKAATGVPAGYVPHDKATGSFVTYESYHTACL